MKWTKKNMGNHEWISILLVSTAGKDALIPKISLITLIDHLSKAVAISSQLLKVVGVKFLCICDTEKKNH